MIPFIYHEYVVHNLFSCNLVVSTDLVSCLSWKLWLHPAENMRTKGFGHYKELCVNVWSLPAAHILFEDPSLLSACLLQTGLSNLRLLYGDTLLVIGNGQSLPTSVPDVPCARQGVRVHITSAAVDVCRFVRFVRSLISEMQWDDG